MPDKEDPKEKKKWYILERSHLSLLLVILLSILFYIGLSHFNILAAGWSQIMEVISPFIGGFAIAYLLNTPTSFFERKFFSNLRAGRVLAITVVYLLAFAVLAILLGLIIPQVIQSVSDLAANMQTYLRDLDRLVQELATQFELDLDSIEDLMGNFQNTVSKVATGLADSLPQILDFGFAIGNGVVAAITAVISSVYMLAGKGWLVPQLKKLLYAAVPKKQSDEFLSLCTLTNRVFLGFINGKIINSAIIGVLCFVLCLILQIPYPMLVSVVVGVTDIIPFFGPFIGAIPCMLILVIVDPWAALRFVIMIIAMQQFDGNIMSPKILGDSTGLPAIWVLVSIVTFGGLFGFAGMLLGVPTFAVIHTLVREWTHHRLAAKGLDGSGHVLPPQEENKPAP